MDTLAVMGEGPPLPDHPELRNLAHALEATGAIGELLDSRWRTVYITSELCRMMGFSTEDAISYYGISPIARDRDHADVWGTDSEGRLVWWERVAPSVLHDVPPEDPAHVAVFGAMAKHASNLEPADPPPLMIPLRQSFPGLAHLELTTWNGDVDFTYARVHDADGEFHGLMNTSRPAIPGTLAARLARGNLPMLERMDRLSEPARRQAAIMFADLEASGDLSRRLSSRAYFELIRSMTDLIDAAVIEHSGITGKHAGDGASALFVVEDGDESGMARSAIGAARTIADGGHQLLGQNAPEVRINVGLHWGATLMVGQVSIAGRLEVTALGDEMNEAARIESVASEGAILCSKQLVERLDAEDAAAVGVEPDVLSYAPLGELGAEGKALRDAGTIAVAEL